LGQRLTVRVAVGLLRTLLAYCGSIGAAGGIIIPAEHVANNSALTASYFLVAIGRVR
jgi:hypothetical protein